MRRRSATAFAAILVAGVLSGCGGGAGGGSVAGGGGGSGPAPLAPPASAASFQTTEFFFNDGLNQINAQDAYATGTSGDGVTVAVIDTGVDPTHPDLAGNLSAASVNILTNGAINDDDGHGTAVAGVIAARKNDSGSHGVAFNSTLLGIRASNITGTFTDADVADAINYAVQRGADVINLSLGGPAAGTPNLEQALISAAAAGVVIVAASGNDGNAFTPLFPAAYAGDVRMGGLLLAVGSVDGANNLSAFSNICGNANANFCLYAPGENVRTTGLGGGNVIANGTSFAAPHVSGGVALLLQLFPSLTPAQAVQILLTSATDLGAAGVDDTFGHGLLNLDAASQPLGALSVPTSDAVEGPAMELEQTTIRLGAAFGDALGGNAFLGDAIILDDFDRPYKIGLGRNVKGAGRELRFDSLLAHRDTETVTLPAADGLSLSIGIDHRTYYRSDAAGLAEQTASGPAFENLNVLGALSDSTRLGFAYNLSPGQTAAARHEGTDTAGLFWMADDSLNPHLSLIGAGNGMSLEQRIGDETRLSFAWLDTVDGDRTIRGSVGQAALQHDFAGGGSLRLGIASVHEDGAFLNSEADGAFGAGTEADSRFYSLSGALPVGEGIDLIGSVTVANTAVDDGGGLLKNWDAVWSGAFGLGVVARDVFGPQDRLGFLAGQPLRVESAEATLTLPVARDLDGNVIQQSERVDLTPSGREIDLQIALRLLQDEGLYAQVVRSAPATALRSQD